MHKIHEFFLTFCYLGKAKKVPGTFGSFGAVVFWFFLARLFFGLEISLETQNFFWAIFLILTFTYGCFASPIYAKKFGEVDHGSIVLDEVVGQVLALQISFLSLEPGYFYDYRLIAIHLFLCFFFFRFFDITKPLFIAAADRLKNGFGVMFDDVLAGICAAITTLVLLKFF